MNEANLREYHFVADDKLASASATLSASAIDDVRNCLHDCMAAISSWCSSRRLQLNEIITDPLIVL